MDPAADRADGLAAADIRVIVPSRARRVLASVGYIQSSQELVQKIVANGPLPPSTDDSFHLPGGTRVSKSVMDLFITNINNDAAFHSHPVVLMTMDHLRRAEPFRYRQPPIFDNLPNPSFPHVIAADDRAASLLGGKPGELVRVSDYLFPQTRGEPRKSPSSLTIDGLAGSQAALLRGGVALTVKSIYNGSARFDDNINTDKALSGTRALNRYLDTHWTALLAHLYRFEYDVGPSADLAQQYMALLRSAYWRESRVGLWIDGQWANAPLEMFHHLVKLKACGASDGDIASVLDFLHQPATEDGLAFPPSLLGPITKANWKQYRGWLHSGVLDWDDMAVSATSVDRHPPLVAAYLKHYEYWKRKRLLSCFAFESPVVMADGISVKPIGRVCVGDTVLARRYVDGGGGIGDGIDNTATCAARVVLVSRPPRAGRNLYELVRLPGVRFTATHPLVCRGNPEKDAEGGIVLAFVDADAAAAGNPSWQSLVTRRMTEDEYRQCDVAEDENRDGSHGTDGDELLYDLVLQFDGPGEEIEIPKGPDSYFLRPNDNVGSGSEILLEAACEMPIIEWFPCAVHFFDAIMEMHNRGDHDGNVLSKLQVVSDGSNDGRNNCSASARLASAARLAWVDFLPQLESSGVTSTSRDLDLDQPSIMTLLGRAGVSEVDKAAMILEELVALLGRSLNDKILMPWLADAYDQRHASTVSGEQQRQPFLVLQTLVTSLPHSIPGDEITVVVERHGVTVARQTIHTAREGTLTYEIQHAIALDQPSHIPGVANPPESDTLGMITIRIGDRLGNPLFVGQGNMRHAIRTVFTLGSDTPHSPDDDGVLVAHSQMLDPNLVAHWQADGALSEQDKKRFARLLGQYFIKGLVGVE